MKLKNYIKYKFSEETISPTTIIHLPDGRANIVIGIPIEYRKDYVQCLLNHEIGTHFLRKYNDRRQIWYQDRKKYKLGSYIQTEEGLAAINMLYEQSQNKPFKPFLFQAALNYFSAYLASYMSFEELFKTLKKYIHNEDKLWRQCMRVKRGKTLIIIYKNSYLIIYFSVSIFEFNSVNMKVFIIGNFIQFQINFII